MPEIFDSENLTERINKIRKEGEDSTEFTLEFLQCLMVRHNLGFSIPTDFSDPDVPQIIFETLTSGELPTKEQILLMDSDTQNHLIIELIWLCGMYAIHNYSVEWGEDYLESILAMLDVDPMGFDVMDRKLLEAILHKFNGGPVGIDNLAAAIGEERDTIEDVLEPFLIQQGYLQRTSRGRIATRQCYEHFGLKAPSNSANLDLLD